MAEQLGSVNERRFLSVLVNRARSSLGRSAVATRRSAGVHTREVLARLLAKCKKLRLQKLYSFCDRAVTNLQNGNAIRLLVAVRA